MLYQGSKPHPAHRVFGDAVNASYRHFESAGSIETHGIKRSGSWARVKSGFGLPRSFDMIIAEGSAPLQTAIVYGFLNPESKIVYLCADETFYTLNERSTRHLWRSIKPVSKRVIDGVITVSELAYEWAQPYLGSIPRRTVHPPIPETRYGKLVRSDVSQNEKQIQILTVGGSRETKNHPALVYAIRQLRSQLNMNLKLTLVGKGHPGEDYAAEPFVATPGFVSNEELCRHHEAADIYVQSSIADAYPVATLEAMLSGTPTIVTESVGTRHRIPSDQVAKPTVDGIFESVNNQLSLDSVERRNRGLRHRESVKDLTETSQARAFEAAIESINSI